MSNYIRYTLYGLLVLICFSLFNVWQKEHPAVINTPKNTIVTSNTEYNKQTSKTPTFSQIKKSNFQKIPKSRIINIHTSIYNIQIDRLGGNIVFAKLLDYKTYDKDKKNIVIVDSNKNNFCLIKSGLTSKQRNDGKQLLYHSNKSNYTIQNNQKELTVTLNGVDSNGLEIKKQFIFLNGQYYIQIIQQIKNTNKKLWHGSYYMQLSYDNHNSNKGGFLGFRKFSGIGIWDPQLHYRQFSFKSLNQKTINEYVKSGWLALTKHYFLVAIIPGENINNHYYTQIENNLFTSNLVGAEIILDPGQTINYKSKFYIGPKISEKLDAAAPKLSLTIDYGWLWFISVVILWLLKLVNRIIGNWGWSIIVVTILIKTMFYKLSEASYKSMAGMRKLQPKIARLKETYTNDKQGMSKALMELYKKEKINPLGGCLPIIIQIPVFIALYYVLLQSVELRQAPFMLWIQDLAVKDPYYILPILMGATMFVQQKLSPPPPDPVQARVMLLLPVVMTIFFVNFPAGLVLYWLMNNVLSIAQQWYVTKRVELGAYKKKHKRKRKNR